ELPPRQGTGAADARVRLKSSLTLIIAYRIMLNVRANRKGQQETGNLRLTTYSIRTSWLVLDSTGSGAGCCGARQESKIDTWWTHETVQCGAQDFSVTNSRRISATE